MSDAPGQIVKRAPRAAKGEAPPAAALKEAKDARLAAERQGAYERRQWLRKQAGWPPERK